MYHNSITCNTIIMDFLNSNYTLTQENYLFWGQQKSSWSSYLCLNVFLCLENRHQLRCLINGTFKEKDSGKRPLQTHPRIHLLALVQSGLRGPGVHGGTPPTGRQPVGELKQRDRQPPTFKLMGNLEIQMNPSPLTVCLWTVRESQSTHREPTQT